MLKLHIGCGNNKIKGWINADINGDVDIIFDAGKCFPFVSDSVDCIFNEHMIEHLTQEKGIIFLSECFRVLKNKSILRISTPDLDYVVHKYINKDIDNIKWNPKPNTSCEYINRAFTLWGHRFMYDKEQLIRTLKESGFSDINKMEYRKSNIEYLCNLESREYRKELIFEAKKLH